MKNFDTVTKLVQDLDSKHSTIQEHLNRSIGYIMNNKKLNSAEKKKEVNNINKIFSTIRSRCNDLSLDQINTRCLIELRRVM